jgi:hypothetical protein
MALYIRHAAGGGDTGLSGTDVSVNVPSIQHTIEASSNGTIWGTTAFSVGSYSLSGNVPVGVSTVTDISGGLGRKWRIIHYIVTPLQYNTEYSWNLTVDCTSAFGDASYDSSPYGTFTTEDTATIYASATITGSSSLSGNAEVESDDESFDPPKPTGATTWNEDGYWNGDITGENMMAKIQRLVALSADSFWYEDV